jgi:hypothetical protein
MALQLQRPITLKSGSPCRYLQQLQKKIPIFVLKLIHLNLPSSVEFWAVNHHYINQVRRGNKSLKNS